MRPAAPSVLHSHDVPEEVGSAYPEPFRAPVAARRRRRLGNALGLTKFGVNRIVLPPGAASSERHWHTREDEFVMVLEGEVVLVTDAGEQTLTAGMCAGFPAGRADGHKLVNRSDRDAVCIEVGNRDPEDETDYPDADLQIRRVDGVRRFVRRDGTPW